MTSTHSQDPPHEHKEHKGGTHAPAEPEPAENEQEQQQQEPEQQPAPTEGETPTQTAPPSAHDNPQIVNGKQVVFPNQSLPAVGSGQQVPVGPH